MCDGAPTVLVGVRHRVMRHWTVDLLETEHGCRTVDAPRQGELLSDAIERSQPALVIVDDADFPACCRAALDVLAPERVIVIGPEPDAAYRAHALANGAGGWVCRDHVGEELSDAMRAALGCRHAPCPPTPASALPEPHTAHMPAVRTVDPVVEVGAEHERPPEPVTDPVCGMTADPSRAAATSTHEGVVYSFCSTGCRDAFAADPDAFVGGHVPLRGGPPAQARSRRCATG